MAKANVYDLLEVKKAGNDTMFVRKNRALLIYQLSDGNYIEVYHKDDFFPLTNRNVNYPWNVYEPSLLIVRSSKGLEVYQWNNAELKLLHTVSKYHDHSAYGLSSNTFLLGKIFPSEWHIGIISRLDSDVQFQIVANHHHSSWLHDQLDMGSILHPINPYNGAIELMLPIIDIPGPFGIPIRKIIQYKNIAYNNELGRGWSFPLDFIMLDRQSSAFNQDHVYSLVKENQRIILMLQPPNEKQPQAQEKHFTIDGYPDIQIMFNQRRNFWTVSMDNRIMTYIALKQFHTTVACPLWPLCGRESRQTQTYSSQWFLNQEDNTDTGLRALYFYDLVKNKTDIRLTAINLSDDSLIELSYKKDRITKISAATHQFTQYFTFHYSDDVEPLLKAITQSERKLFNFEYGQRLRLSKIVYPNGAEWRPEYVQVTINPTSLKKTIPIETEASVYYGPDYVVVVDANLIDGRLLLHIRDPLGGISSNKTDSMETVYTLNDIKRYLVHAIENLIVVIVIYDSYKDIAILQYINDRWRQQKYYDGFPLDGTVTTGNKFVLLSDKKSLRFVTATSDHKLSEIELRPQLPANFAVKAFPHGYATYDGQLEIFLLQSNGQWITVKAPAEKRNYFNEIDNFVASFAISRELSQSIRRGLTADMLGNYKQAIVLKAPVLHNDALNIHVRFFMLDLNDKPRIFDCYTTVVPHTVLPNYNYTVKTEGNDSFVLGYRLVEKKYHLYVKKSTGPHAAELNKYTAAAKKEMAKHARGSTMWKKIYDEAKKTIREESQRIYKTVKDAVVFAIDLSQFGMLTNQDGVLTGNHQITYDGHNWNKRFLDEDTIRLHMINQSLSSDYRLVKAHREDTFKIVSNANGATIFDTKTTRSEEIQLTVPYYAQAQPKNSPLRVYFFESKQTVTFPDEERMNRASNQIAIITTHRANETAQLLLFRCMKYFLSPNVTVLESQTLSYTGETERKTEYIYDPQDIQMSVDGIVFRKIKIAPGADKSRFGWYEQSIDIPTGNTVRKAISADGQEVLDRKLRDQEEKRRQSEKQDTSAHSEWMIMDLNGRHPIVDLGPYRLADEMVFYYGFEPYEKNHYGKAKKLMFDTKLVKSQHGNTFLSLTQPEHKLTGEFIPQEPHMMFVLSCWVRSSKALKLGDTIDIVTIDVAVEGSGEEKKLGSKEAKVKQCIGSWSYVETIIDTTHFPTNTKLSFLVSLMPSATHQSIDIDHIRFSPLNMPFAANIYEPGRGGVIAVLTSTGLMKRYLYNGKGKRTTVCSEQGIVEEFITESKVMYTRESGHRPCVLEYESPDMVRIREILYDDIERPILQTKWTKVHHATDTNMFAFHEDFIHNFNSSTLLLTGMVADLNPTCKGFPYTHTIYGNDPTENKRLQGLPGQDYTVRGKYKRSYTNVPHNLLLSNLFPEREGFHHKAVHLPGGAVRVTIENAQGKKVAKYYKVGNYENRLSTWRYGKNGKIQQELPPMYHYEAQTSTMESVPFFVANHTSEQLKLQKQWEVRYDYDDANRLIRKRTPDGGILQYLYDKQGILRFSLHKEHNETLDRAIHFTYVADDKVAREALVQLNEAECISLTNSGVAPNSTNFIDTLYGEYDDDPNMRYRSAFASRRISGDQMTEYLVFDQNKRVLKKVYVVNTINTSYSIDYEYENDNLRTIKYPFGAGEEPFKLIYDFNDGMMETMSVRTDAKHTFQRKFTYNEPGFLVKLEDKYLTESVSYLETDSYGQDSYTPIYEGLISQTLFTAHWQKMASPLRN
uniref:Tox-SGS domain-containing protein n=1 Tax=Anopheles christyi TaxID=43041 RepID=A0A182K318_9DIPT